MESVIYLPNIPDRSTEELLETMRADYVSRDIRKAIIDELLERHKRQELLQTEALERIEKSNEILTRLLNG